MREINELYFNWVNLQYMGDAELDFKVLKNALRSRLDESGIHQAVLKDIATLLEDHAATFTLYTSMIEEILLSTASDIAWRAAWQSRSRHPPTG